MKKPGSNVNAGTYQSNAIRSGNSNALADITKNYEKVKEFFKVHVEALIVSSFLKQEGFESTDDKRLSDS